MLPSRDGLSSPWFRWLRCTYGFYYYYDQLSERLNGDARGDLNRGWQLPLAYNKIPAGQDNIQHWAAEGSFKNCQLGPRMGHPIEAWAYNPSSDRNLFWDNFYSLYRDYSTYAPDGLHGTWGAVMSLADLKAKALIDNKYTVQTLKGTDDVTYDEAIIFPNYGSSCESNPVSLGAGPASVITTGTSYPTEFGFNVKNAAGETVASGNYSNKDFTIPESGDYTFENTDVYGDGGIYVTSVNSTLSEPILADKDFVDAETYAADMSLSVKLNTLADGATLCVSQYPQEWRDREESSTGGSCKHDFTAATAEACQGLFDNGRMNYNEKNIFIGDLSVAVFSDASIQIGDTLSTTDGSQSAVATKAGEITIPFTNVPTWR